MMLMGHPLVNADKLQVFFLNTTPIVHRNIVRNLGFTKGTFPSKYLRVTLGVGTIKNVSWKDLLDRFKSRLSRWILHPLNIPSRMVLVKFVLQAMPIYLFFVSFSPKSIIKDIRSIQRNFLVGGREVKSKFSLVRWEKIFYHRERGGLGLRDPKTMSGIQGAKIWW